MQAVVYNLDVDRYNLDVEMPRQYLDAARRFVIKDADKRLQHTEWTAPNRSAIYVDFKNMRGSIGMFSSYNDLSDNWVLGNLNPATLQSFFA